MTTGLLAHPVSVGFQSMDAISLPIEKEKTKESIEMTSKRVVPETASLFNSTYTIVFVGLVAVYMLLLRKRESRGMNL